MVFFRARTSLRRRTPPSWSRRIPRASRCTTAALRCTTSTWWTGRWHFCTAPMTRWCRRSRAASATRVWRRAEWPPCSESSRARRTASRRRTRLRCAWTWPTASCAGPSASSHQWTLRWEDKEGFWNIENHVSGPLLGVLASKFEGPFSRGFWSEENFHKKIGQKTSF